MLGLDDAVLAGLSAMLAPRGQATVLYSVVPRDGMPAIPPLDQIRDAYERHGMGVTDARPATADEVTRSHSSWAKRLRAATSRPVTLLRSSTG